MEFKLLKSLTTHQLSSQTTNTGSQCVQNVMPAKTIQMKKSITSVLIACLPQSVQSVLCMALTEVMKSQQSEKPTHK
jgi:hypothetical protein